MNAGHLNTHHVTRFFTFNTGTFKVVGAIVVLPDEIVESILPAASAPAR